MGRYPSLGLQGGARGGCESFKPKARKKRYLGLHFECCPIRYSEEVGEVNAPWPPLIRLLRPLATSPQTGEEWRVSYSVCETSYTEDLYGGANDDG